MAKISQEQLDRFLKAEIQPKKNDRMLLAVSGGADSMVMLHMLYELGYQILVAHVNFGLRGAESENDEALVQDICDRLKIDFFVNRFDTLQESALRKQGIQEVARDLRYAWFEEMRVNHHCNFIATAHNATDNVETVLINQLRGSGLKGMAGIPIKRGHIIRPMMHFTSEEIRSYARENGIAYRNDSSNESDKYLRNQLRHHVVPELHKIESGLEQRFLENSKEVREWLEMLDFLLVEASSKVTSHQENGELDISISGVRSYPQPHLLLYQILSSYGFNLSQCRDMSLIQQSGNVYNSDGFEVIVHGDFWRLKDKAELETKVIEIDNWGSFDFGNGRLNVSSISKADVVFGDDKNVAFFDAGLVKFPIAIRSWKEGDLMQPLGMKGKKLLSDLLVDAKIPVFDKKNIPVLEYDGQIVWLAGIRQSEFGKIGSETELVVKMIWVE